MLEFLDVVKSQVIKDYDEAYDNLGWGEMPNYIPCVVYEFDRIIPFTDLYEAIYYYEQITKGE